jgi:uncharacterized protein
MVANFGLRPSRDPMVAHVMVPQGADIADDWIVEHASAGSIVVTSDILLAGRALEKGAVVLGPTGRPFTKDSIGMALAVRDLNQHCARPARAAGSMPGSRQKTAARSCRHWMRPWCAPSAAKAGALSAEGRCGLETARKIQ